MIGGRVGAPFRTKLFEDAYARKGSMYTSNALVLYGSIVMGF